MIFAHYGKICYAHKVVSVLYDPTSLPVPLVI